MSYCEIKKRIYYISQYLYDRAYSCYICEHHIRFPVMVLNLEYRISLQTPATVQKVDWNKKRIIF